MTPHAALKQYFGFSGFLDGQEEVISEIVSGRDGLVVMPTGGGKSLCFQIPALCFGGVTLVISPLIALMKDQVDALVARGIEATVINSTLCAGRSRRSASMACATGNTNSSMSRPNASAPRVSSTRSTASKSRSSPWTRRTASASGAMISGRTTCASARRWKKSAARNASL